MIKRKLETKRNEMKGDWAHHKTNDFISNFSSTTKK